MIHSSDTDHRSSKILAFILMALVGLLLLPAGDYRVHEATVRVSSLEYPFGDYGIFLATAVALFVVITIGVRLRGYRRRVSPLSYVIASGSVLGLMVPDVITPGVRTLKIGANRHVSVNLLAGFWLTFAAAILLFIIASAMFFVEKSASAVHRYDFRSDVQLGQVEDVPMGG